jgi:hypothetical protein
LLAGVTVARGFDGEEERGMQRHSARLEEEKKWRERERELAHGPRAAVDCSIDKRARPEKENIFFEISFYSTESNLF